jgi:phosphoribosylanthranilate isomerase
MEPEHAIVAAEAGVDFLGFLFAESRRRVSPERARTIIEAARNAGGSFRAVGLFVGATPAEVTAVHRVAGLDLVQLHGEYEAEDLKAMPVPAIVVIRASPDDPLEDLLNRASAAMAAGAEMIMIDGYHPTLMGGTGLRADWNVARALAEAVPLLLAGGLDSENVASAIGHVQPFGVDVSSGVERDGTKSPERIAAFIQAARAGFDQSISSGTSSQLTP